MLKKTVEFLQTFILAPMKILLIEKCARDFVYSRLDYLQYLSDKGYKVAACIPFPKISIEVSFPIYFYSITKPWLIYGAIKTFRPDRLHIFRLLPILFGVFSKTPVVAHTTGLGLIFTHRLYIPMRPFFYLALIRASKIIVQNSNDLSFLKRNLTLIPGSGIKLGKAESISKIPNVFLSAGRLIWEKGFSTLIKAFQWYKSIHPEAQLWIAGLHVRKHPHKIWNCTLKKWSKIPGVTFHFDLENIDLLLMKASYYVHPGYYREGLPRTLLEAMNHSIPVIATDIPGCRDLIENGVNGILAPANDSTEMYRAMEKVTQMHFEKKSMIKYSKEVIYPQMEKTYQLCGSTGSALS